MIRNQIIMDVVEEYLEEAAFLYEHRYSLHDNPEITWRDMEEFETRLEDHLDGLVLSEKVGIEACKQRIKENDPLDLFTALCVYCRQQKKELVMETIRKW